MNTVRRIVLLLVASTAALALAGCEKKEEREYNAPTVELIISTRTVVVRDVTFMNSDAGRALTRVTTVEERGPASMEKYDFPGYHPEITLGLKGQVAYLYRETYTSDYYMTQLCVIPLQSKVCTYQKSYP